MAIKKTSNFMGWINARMAQDPSLARDVEERVNEMKIEQEIVALREKRGLTQRDVAKLLGTTQPYVAKLESGRIKNLGVKTLVRCATALGGRVTLKIQPLRRALAPVQAKAARRAHTRAARRAK